MTVNDFINTLIASNWNVKLKEKSAFSSNVLSNRHETLPDTYTEFLSKVAYCVNPENDVWFLCEDDFEGKSGMAFVWNEFEIQSLEAASGEKDLTWQIKSFWKTHITIIYSVKNCYEYLGISLKEDGAIVHGEEPIYENVGKICESFDELMEKITLILSAKNTFSLLDLL